MSPEQPLYCIDKQEGVYVYQEYVVTHSILKLFVSMKDMVIIITVYVTEQIYREYSRV